MGECSKEEERGEKRERVDMGMNETITVPRIIESQTVLNHSSFIHQQMHTCTHTHTGVPTQHTHTHTHIHTFVELILQVLVLFLESFNIFRSYASL